jgi:Rha family phage regulatory protein
MIQVIQTENGYRVSSKEVAKNFKKNHAHVLRDIRDLKSKLENSSIFYSSNFGSNKINTLDGIKIDEVLMTKDGLTLLAMGFTGTDALLWKIKYLNAFNEMESQILETVKLKEENQNLRSQLDRKNQKQIGQSKKGFMMVPVRQPSLFSAEGEIKYVRQSTEGIPELAIVKAQMHHAIKTMTGIQSKIVKMEARLDLGY